MKKFGSKNKIALVAFICLAVFVISSMTILPGVSAQSQTADQNQAPSAGVIDTAYAEGLTPTNFGPASIYSGEVLRISGFNSTDRPIKYTIDIRDALTGEKFTDVGTIDTYFVPPNTGFTRVQTFPNELLVVIAIVGVVVGPSGEEIAYPAPQTPLSAEIAGVTDDDIPVFRLLLPAVQSFRIGMSSGREGSSGQITSFGPATVLPGEAVRISGFNTTNRRIKYIVDARDALTGEPFAERGEFIVPPKNGFTIDSRPEIISEAASNLVVITIIGMFWDREELPTGRAKPTPISAEIVMVDGSIKLSLPSLETYSIGWMTIESE